MRSVLRGLLQLELHFSGQPPVSIKKARSTVEQSISVLDKLQHAWEVVEVI